MTTKKATMDYDAPKLRDKSVTGAPAAAAEHSYLDLSEERRRAWSYFLKAYKVVVDAVDTDMRRAAPISLAEYELLLHVKRAGDRIRFIDLANLTLLSQSRISRQIDTLQARGLLHREITDTDRRATYAVLTPAGQAAFDLAGEAFVGAFRRHFLDLIPEGQLSVLSSILEPLLPEPDYRSKRATPSDGRTPQAA